MNDYTTNPLNSSILFSIGQPVMVILLVLSAVAGLILLISRIAKINNLEIIANRWFERIVLVTLHTGLIWLGLTMLITYISFGPMDAINGAVILSGAITSIVYRATGTQSKANHALTAMLIFLGVVLLWTFIASNVLSALPSTVRDSITDNVRPSFFRDLFQYWHWIQ